MSATIGWVLGNWSCVYAHALRRFANATQASVNSVAVAEACEPM